jgi:hypothetical protein
MFLRGIAPPQTIAVNEDNSVQQAPTADSRLAMALGEERLKVGHLRVCQPEKAAH